MQLAKWDDRGYYAMRASTEKAQRYLHRLSRRAEEVLRQPAATALATAVKGMGVGELAGAAAAVSRADGEEDDAAAAAAGGAGAEAKAQGADGDAKQQPAVKKAKKGKKSAEQAKAEAEANDLAGAEADGNGGPAAEAKALWAQLSAAAAEAVSNDMELQGVLTSLGGGGASAASAAGAYLPRLPQLASRLGRVLGGSLFPAADAAAGDADDDGADADATAMTPDELAATAIVRSHELRTDVTKGARMRKRQALGDLFAALEQQGLSRRVTAVPQHDRDVAAWFKHPQPAPEALWPAVDDLTAAHAAASWSRADDYYYRAMARLQKLWRGAAQPHKDLSLAEVSTARRLCEHVLYVVRRQRRALGETAALVQALDRMAGWLREAGAAAADSGVVQSEALAALAGQKEHLDSLALLGAETCQLLGACSGAVTPAAATADQAAALGCALGAARAATEAATACKRRLDAALAACAVSVPAAAEAGEAAVDGLTWATQAAVDAAAANKAALAAASAELTAALERVDGAAAAPGVEALAAALSAAATAAAATLEPLVGAAAAADVAADGAAPSGEVAEAAEALVRSLLVWAQPGQAQQATKAAAHGADAGAAKGSANPQALVHGTAEHEAGLKLPRGRELAAGAAALLRRLAAAPSRPGGAARALLRGVAPLLGLAAEALRARGLQLLALHRSTSKLSYVVGAVLSTIVEEGYCVPEETKEVEGEWGLWKGRRDGFTTAYSYRHLRRTRPRSQRMAWVARVGGRTASTLYDLRSLSWMPVLLP